MTDLGGGASRSTDPAHGSSAATDVSLREFIDQRLRDIMRLLDERTEADRRAVNKAENAATLALVAAREEAKERLLAHNGLIEQMRQQAEKLEQASLREAAGYATKAELKALEKNVISLEERIVDRLHSIDAKLDRQTGIGEGRTSVWNNIGTIITIGVGVLLLLVAAAAFFAGGAS